MLAMLLLAVARHAFGQDVGLKAGMGHNGLAGNSEFDWSRSAMSASAFAILPVNDEIELQPEIWLRQRKGRSVVGTSELALRAGYLAIPLLARRTFAVTRVGVPYLLAGPTLSYRTSCSLTFATDSFTSPIGCDVTDRRRVSLELEGGAGIELGRKSSRFVIELRASRSFWSVAVGVVRPLRSADPSSTPSAPLPRPVPDEPAPPIPAR
jgi:hypothetical protein